MKTGISVLILFCFACLWGGCSNTPYSSLPDYEQMSAAEIDNLIAAGLKAWRAPGGIDTGASCAGCHSPDGFDLAAIGFNDFHIRRRGAMHVGDEITGLSASKLEDIVNMIHALRVKHNITPEDPLEFRPFQPGGNVLPGQTASEKEQQFMSALQQQSFRFAHVPVLDKEEAAVQKKEWLSLNPAHIRIGISLNRWSEDPYYQLDGAPLADWLPVLPVLPKTGKEQLWYSLHDQYLGNPSDDHLLAILQEMDQLAYVPFDGAAGELMRQKYRAVFIAQHFFRKKSIDTTPGKTGWKRTGSFLDVSENPFLEVALLAHQLQETNTFELPGRLSYKYYNHLENHKNEQLRQMQHAWFWLSWLLNPSAINNTLFSDEPNTNTGSTPAALFSAFSEEYPLHYTYLFTKSTVEKAYNSFTDSGHSRQVFSPPAVVNIRPEILENEHQVLFIENTWRMILLLYLDQTGLPVQGTQTGLNQHAYQPNVIAKWTETISQIEAGFKNMNSPHIDYNLQLVQKVNERLAASWDAGFVTK